MTSCIDDGWEDDQDLDFSVTSLGNDNWGDDGLLSDDSDNNEEDVDLDFPPAAPTVPPTNSFSEEFESSNGQGKLNVKVDHKAQPGIESSCRRHNTTKTILSESQRITVAPSKPVSTPNDCHLKGRNMITELSNYIKSLDRMLTSINAVLEFEYNTRQKAEELVEYYENRPQLAEYTRTKELHRMNYEVISPHGYVETDKGRIVSENLLPDIAIVSRAANQSLLADLLQVITGHDLIVRPQYFTVSIATWCKFVIHLGDQGTDMIDCRAKLSLFLPTTEGDRLIIAEVTVSAIFCPGKPMVEFKVIKIEVLLKDFSKLSGVADFLSAMEGNNEDHQVINSSPDVYRDAFLEKSQRFFALSSEGMKSAFKQMDSVINFRGKMHSISSFIPDTDQLLAVEEEAIAFAEARKELQQQHESSFPRPPPTLESNPSSRRLQKSLHTGDLNRPKSILGGLVRSGWKTLANSVAIPDDDPAIYGEFVPSQPPPTTFHSDPGQQLLLYRKEEDKPPLGPPLYENNDTEIVLNSNQKKRQQMHYHQKGDSGSHPRGSNVHDKVRVIDSNNHHFIGSQCPSKYGINEDIDGRGTPASESGSYGLKNMEHGVIDAESNDSFQPDDVIGLNREKVEANDQEVNKEVIDKNCMDGWEDDFDDDFDDVSDDVDENFGQRKLLLEQNQEGGIVFASPLEAVHSSLVTEKMLHSSDTKYDEEDDICETRRRWVNPRPNRPYIFY